MPQMTWICHIKEEKKISSWSKQKVFDCEEKKKRPFDTHPAHPAHPHPATLITNDISATYTMSAPVPESITIMIDAVVINSAGMLPTLAILFPDSAMLLILL
jgi:hypothetical protein